LAKLENNSLKLNYVQGDVLAYLRYIAQSLQSLANTSNVMLRVESDESKIVMDYDPERLLQIVHNLLSNAIKFTPPSGQVTLQVKLSESWLQIFVADTGVGIAPEELPLVFDRFFQAKNQEHASPSPLGRRAGLGQGGAGIGLSLTKELVKVMGGEITAESEVGKGTTFKVVLPITNKTKKAEEPNQGLLNFQSLVNLPESTPPITNHQSTNHQLLIIEDNPDVVEYLAACLGPCYQLDFAYNGQSGIEKAIETVPDLIISDVMMPKKDGFEVVETLKLDERTSHIPIVLLTARADVESRIAGLRRGADAYLAKPFVEEELLVVAGNLLETRRKLQEKYRNTGFGTQPAEPGITEVQEPKSVFDHEDVFLKKTIALIDANLDDAEFGNAELSRKMLMSESQLHRKIKALTDQSLSVFIRSVRLRRGKALLQNSDLTIWEVAYAVGFTDPAYFSRTFSAEFGIAPTAVRKG